MTELVSIVTPLYNSERYIGETIKSVQAQTYTNWEMLVVDNCSTDGSVDVIRSFQNEDERIKLIQLKRNEGPAIARNTGIREAKGRFIIFLDSDDVWYPHLLETEVPFIKEKDAGAVYASGAVT